MARSRKSKVRPVRFDGNRHEGADGQREGEEAEEEIPREVGTRTTTVRSRCGLPELGFGRAARSELIAGGGASDRSQTNLHPPSASRGNMYLHWLHCTSGVGAGRPSLLASTCPRSSPLCDLLLEATSYSPFTRATQARPPATPNSHVRNLHGTPIRGFSAAFSHCDRFGRRFIIAMASEAASRKPRGRRRVFMRRRSAKLPSSPMRGGSERRAEHRISSAGSPSWR